MKKKLIFYFYITPDFFERKTNLVNVECLRYYSQIFDDIVIYLSLNDTADYELIRRIEEIFIKFPHKGNISFKIHKNDDFRESIVLKEAIADRLQEEDSLIFFAHGKGFTNLEQYDEESMLHWLIGCYYLSLNFLDEVEYSIDGNDRIWSCYGAFPLVQKDKIGIEDDYWEHRYLGSIKYQWCYSGTFFWINPKRLWMAVRNYDIEMPKLFDRYYSEKFLGNLVPFNNYGTGHNNFHLYGNNNMYNKGVALECIKAIIPTEKEQEEYMNFYKFILDNVKNKWTK